MWSALHWELWKPWGCCFVDDVVTLQVSLLFTEGGWGGWGGVITSCGVRWMQSCGNLEDVASLTMLLRCMYRCCSRSKQLLQKAFLDVKMKKAWCSFRPWFSSELWHFLVINNQKCMKPQFQWLECCTHFWPSMEDVNLSFFCADKRQVYPRRHWNFGWSNTFREKHKTL